MTYIIYYYLYYFTTMSLSEKESDEHHFKVGAQQHNIEFLECLARVAMHLSVTEIAYGQDGEKTTDGARAGAGVCHVRLAAALGRFFQEHMLLVDPKKGRGVPGLSGAGKKSEHVIQLPRTTHFPYDRARIRRVMDILPPNRLRPSPRRRLECTSKYCWRSALDST